VTASLPRNWRISLSTAKAIWGGYSLAKSIPPVRSLPVYRTTDRIPTCSVVRIAARSSCGTGFSLGRVLSAWLQYHVSARLLASLLACFPSIPHGAVVSSCSLLDSQLDPAIGHQAREGFPNSMTMRRALSRREITLLHSVCDPPLHRYLTFNDTPYGHRCPSSLPTQFWPVLLCWTACSVSLLA